MEHIKGHTQHYDALYRQRHANGQWVWVHSRGRVIERDAKGRAVRMVGIAINVDRQKRLEAELAQANSDLLVQVERTESIARAKSQFLANVAHEIRTPLNGIVGAAQLALLTDDADQQRADISVVHSAAQDLLDLVTRVLDMSRLEAGALSLELAPLSILDLVTSLRTQFEPQALLKGLSLTATVATGVPAYVMGDALRLRQVLGNLVSNALKFTERGTVAIQVEAAALPDGGRDGAVVFSVSDTGIGIEPGQLSRVFAPFEQANPMIARRFGGTGLGLHISRQLVERMGGRIEVQSVPGAGSRFVVSIPFERAEFPEVSAPPTVAAVHAHAASGPVSAVADALAAQLQGAAEGLAGRRVLVVDDNPMNRIVAQRFLHQAGLLTEAAESAAEALEALEHSHFDAVLMDLYMPELNGDDATRRLRARWPALPVIAVSASVTVEEVQRCLECGMQDFLTKPIDPVRLFSVLRQVCLPE